MKQLLALFFSLAAVPALADMADEVEHRYADSDGVRIHYAAAGEGPLVVMIHGFPDYWYSWRHQMYALQDRFKVAAIDQRGYNRSGQPQGVESYAMPLLVGDVAAVIAAEGAEKAIVVGHDWGGAVAWNIAMARPELVDLLVILNLPHPNGLAREMRNNPAQQANSQYARDFQQPGAHKMLTSEGLAGWVSDEDARARYVEAFERSDFEAMLNYYKANYPRPDSGEAGLTPPSPPKVRMPVLMFHGLDDQALLPAALNGTWNWLEQDLTLVTVPGAGHFVQQDAADLVSATLRSWLLQRRG
ncbi:MAG: alpha/beta hydrolase [Gammaproteobacteria bacterium]|nr:alpha/beta hydrolase [Gammaproteobacteria bacterium]MXY04268.1 alpha/beta hydrolase [Gammaproteobacteria bacterium]MYE49980.1 alpha/beta hydrolase [Gammaproteobacteria bacterium]MYE87083.1 alpha/beta hydrolase [Gammaproteobacteria bacterium]MYF11899.1 alpha/beta hydrolase [Gammaproteobacteria bacterium]